eukprot:TRINITY_DN7402_c0_g1_i4.p1 TRINITY_DN7402_c0_g1~~TRINITY_DN7402_c0_g1_i4.p1  ORF type:complete len:261 (-),score=54.60 TRINITY_DN7402_c0_g1_i4:92-874(-)
MRPERKPLQAEVELISIESPVTMESNLPSFPRSGSELNKIISPNEVTQDEENSARGRAETEAKESRDSDWRTRMAEVEKKVALILKMTNGVPLEPPSERRKPQKTKKLSKDKRKALSKQKGKSGKPSEVEDSEVKAGQLRVMLKPAIVVEENSAEEVKSPVEDSARSAQTPPSKTVIRIPRTGITFKPTTEANSLDISKSERITNENSCGPSAGLKQQKKKKKKGLNIKRDCYCRAVQSDANVGVVLSKLVLLSSLMSVM